MINIFCLFFLSVVFQAALLPCLAYSRGMCSPCKVRRVMWNEFFLKILELVKQNFVKFIKFFLCTASMWFTTFVCTRSKDWFRKVSSGSYSAAHPWLSKNTEVIKGSLHKDVRGKRTAWKPCYFVLISAIDRFSFLEWTRQIFSLEY